MRFVVIFANYLIWHYGRAIADLTHIYGNLIRFTFNFFSLTILLRSYFSPWRRMGESYPERSMEITAYLSVFTVNMIMRCVGIFMRTIIIIIGLMATILVIVSYPLILLTWLILPLLVVFFFLVGLGLLIR